MRLLIDDNVILDVLMDRRPFIYDSANVWRLCETGLAQGIVSTHTIANIMYIARKQWDPQTREEMFGRIRAIFQTP